MTEINTYQLYLLYTIDIVKLRKLLSAYRTKFFGQKARFRQVSILDRELLLSNSIVKAKADKDDAWWYALAQNHSNIYDIGANVGYSSILACINDPDKKILLADPNADAIAIAKTNLEINGMGANKQYVNFFISDKSGAHVKFFTLGSGSAGSIFSSHADSASSVNAYRMAETVTLDDIVDMGGSVPDLVKIDVEAAESYVLEGGVQLAKNQSTIFLVEMHGPDEMPMIKNAGLVLDWCYKNNYTPYYMKEHIELKTAEQIAHRGRCHLLLMPKGAPYPEYLKSINEGDEVK